ncbi:hypothetical protein CHREV_033 [Choristoneura rosaceana entomopoxvirus 'L']|uniref:N1R/p28-like protein n=1 Tax=Choristoneura rosaceana entomopoxvirus 'L' TaxID=1293539 RepID=A0ABM9QK77_9POXV|nr:hypothetical protein CHREV_033 [Choristoneura rosaceana entomopoxvirus 'L']CCU55935.1 hypothetical protein CHREV_033 [Choristoneura rosaceana entomopoxvirus 'L']
MHIIIYFLSITMIRNCYFYTIYISKYIFSHFFIINNLFLYFNILIYINSIKIFIIYLKKYISF